MKLHYGDMTDSSSLIKIISAVRPNEIYNLAAQSHVKVSFDLSEYTAEVDAGKLKFQQQFPQHNRISRVQYAFIDVNFYF